MATTLFTEVTYQLSNLLTYIEIGEIGLPEIQRPFVWPNTKVRDLFDSMYRGFPVGYLLFWVNGLSGNHRQIGAEHKQKAARLLIVDGQQRLTSLYAVLKGIPVIRADFRKERIYIAFRPKDQKFEVADAAIRRDPEWIPDISELWGGDKSRSKFVKAFFTRLSESRDVSEDEEDRLSEVIDRLYDIQNYPFTSLELTQTVNEEEVADVFVRINSRGTPLNQADFILTLMSVFWDEGRLALEQFCRQARLPSTDGPSPFNHFIQPDPDQLLRVSVGLGFRRARLEHVYSILRGKDLQTGEFSEERRDQQFEVLKTAQAVVLDLQNWHEFLKTLARAGYRSGDMISSQMGLLYSYVLYLVGRRDFHVAPHPLRGVIARWFFMSAVTGRYTGSSETVMDQDLARLRGATSADDFISILDRVIADTLTEDYWSITLPNELGTSSAFSPTLFAYYAALNLLDAKVLFSELKVSELLDPATRAKKTALERHHLFPKGYLRTLGITAQRDTNQIANYALVEWMDNVDISDKAPSVYLPKHESRFQSRELSKMRYWHALPKGWDKMPYREFLEARRQGIAKVIRDGFAVLG